VAVINTARALFSRFSILRSLRCDSEMVSGAVALPDSLPGRAASGCSGSLYQLTVQGHRVSASRSLRCSPSLSSPSSSSFRLFQ
jgi:hypothetical protein